MKEHAALFRAFNRFYTPIIGLLDQRYLDSEFALTEVRILYELHYAPDGATAKDLAGQLKLDKGYLSRILLQFENKRLIFKEKSAQDGRSLKLRLTAKGKQVFQKLDIASELRAMQLLRTIPPDEVIQLIEHMGAIQTILAKIKINDHDGN